MRRRTGNTRLRILAMIVALCVTFTSLPAMGGFLDVHAATNKITVTATCNGWTNTVALRWNRISNPQQGYAVIVNGKVWKHLGKWTNYYVVKGLRSDTKYTFRVRTWRKVRSKMWYNTRTRKWQWTDPGWRYRGRTNYGMRIVYGTCSPAVYKTTAKVKYTIKYDANGGTGAPANGVKLQNTAFKVSTQRPTKAWYRFTGWTIVETGYKNLQPGGTITAGSNRSYTLKAQWVRVYAIHYDANGGTGAPATGGKVHNVAYKVPTTVPTKEGYKFLHWLILETERTVSPGSTITAGSNSDYHLRAQWEKVTTYEDTGGSTGDNTGSNTGGNSSGNTGGNTGGETSPIPKKVTVVSYRGEKSELIVCNGKYYWNEDDLADDIPLRAGVLIKYDRTVDGEFTDSYGAWIQKGGVTFKKDDLVNQTKPTASTTPGYEQFKVEMFNGDPEKLEFSIVNPIRTISTYDEDKNPETRMYIASKRFLLTQVFDPRVYSGTAGSKIKELRIGRLDDNITRCGFASENICINIIYDGHQMGRITYNPNPNGTPMHPRRQTYFDIAQAAIDSNGGPKSLEEDLEAIEEYVAANYTYDEINCIGGYQILESWSIYQYDEYGFQGHGTALPNQDNYSSHVAFHLDSNPNRFFETQGHY